MKIFLLFYMCHFAMGLTHCYKTTSFFYIYKQYIRLNSNCRLTVTQLSVWLRADLRRSFERQRVDRFVLWPVVGRGRLLDRRQHVHRVRDEERPQWAALLAVRHRRGHRRYPASRLQGQLRYNRPVRWSRYTSRSQLTLLAYVVNCQAPAAMALSCLSVRLSVANA